MDIREKRKEEHLHWALHLNKHPLTTWLEDVHIMHNCLPNMNVQDVKLSVALGAGLLLEKPLFINAITGGAKVAVGVNTRLAQIANRHQLAMAVGSQYGTIHKELDEESYRVVRKYNPQGIVFANMSALATVAEAQKAVEMLQANALQIHLNVAQELAMGEGDREFTGYLQKLEQLQKAIEVPLLVKETGCGIAAQQIAQLESIGVTLIDISGAGGTNFPLIETSRRLEPSPALEGWGIPTALTLLEAAGVKQQNKVSILASGGINTVEDCFKALCLGASACGMAKQMLLLAQGTDDEADAYLQKFFTLLRSLMVLVGAKQVEDLRQVPMYFTGALYQALQSLGYDLPALSQQR